MLGNASSLPRLDVFVVGGGLLLGGLLTNLSLLEPSLLDSALFSPLGSLFLAAALTAANGGYLLGGL